MILNSFAIVLRESKGAVLLMELPTIEVSGDSFRGYETPDLGIAALRHLDVKHIFRAKKKYKDNGEGYQHKAGQQCPEQVGLISS